MKHTLIEQYGLTDHIRKQAASFPCLHIGRIITQQRQLYRVVCHDSTFLAAVSGKYSYEAAASPDYPAVGDFVLLDRPSGAQGNGLIQHILPRSSLFLRRRADSHEAQAVAANVDTIFLCMSLNHDFNLRRMERYLALAWESGAQPVVVLTKADLCSDIQRKSCAIASVSCGVDILITSSMEPDGYQQLLTYCTPGKTVALLGSSGVGKSTLVNHLLGQNQLPTQEIRNDHRGRHTTTQRQLLLLPNGCMMIDTPGMRELGMWDAAQGLEQSFPDVEQYLHKCRFRNCTHTQEPGCAVYAAMEQGELSPTRWAAYRKLKAESSFSEDKAQHLQQKKQFQKQISKLNKTRRKDPFY